MLKPKQKHFGEEETSQSSYDETTPATISNSKSRVHFSKRQAENSSEESYHSVQV